MSGIKDKVVVIIGASSRIGAATAVVLAEHGAESTSPPNLPDFCKRTNGLPALQVSKHGVLTGIPGNRTHIYIETAVRAGFIEDRPPTQAADLPSRVWKRLSSSTRRDSYDSQVGHSPFCSIHSGCCSRKAS
jgi:hypothetical protein